MFQLDNIQFILRSLMPKEYKSKEDPERNIMIPENMDDHDRMLGFAKLFMKARAIYMASRALTEDEIEDLRATCAELGAFFLKNFPEESVTPKMHYIVEHYPAFARMWGSIGMYSEQNMESTHPHINQLQRTYATIPNKGEQLKQVFRQHHLQQSPGLEIRPRVRKCKTCGLPISKKQTPCCTCIKRSG
jgi:hypothetical protein